MTSTRLVGILMIVIGAALLYVGISASHSLADQFKHTFTGHFTDTTTWYLLGGFGSVAFGMLMYAFGARRRRRRA